MAWLALTETEVLERLTDDEARAAEIAGENDDTPNNKLPGIIRQVTGKVRGYVGACTRNLPLGPDGTIPAECEWAAIGLIRHALVASVPSWEGSAPADREREYTDANTFLERVANCEVAITPHDGDTTQPATDDVCVLSSGPKLDFSQ